MTHYIHNGLFTHLPLSARLCVSAGLACWILASGGAAMAAEYKPEAGYGPFDRQIQENRLIVANVARQLELPQELMLAVAASESGFAGKARSEKGAVGIMQVMPPTAREVATELGMEKWDLEEPFHNALIGGLYLRKMLARYGGDASLALAAYNAGPTAVDEWIAKSSKRAKGTEIVKRWAFPETRVYVHDVLQRSGNRLFFSVQPNCAAPGTNGVVSRYACVVSNDDTMSSVARRHGIGIRDLWQLNFRRLNAAGDGVILAPGRTVWLRPLPVVLAYAPERRGELRARDVEITVNKAGQFLEIAVAGTVVRRFRLAGDGNSDDGRTGALDSGTPEGEYYVCRKLPAATHGRALQLSYPNENDAWNAFLNGRMSEDEYDGIIDCISRGEAPPSNTELGGEVCIRGNGKPADRTDGSLALDDADAEEIFALAPNGARVVITAGE